MSGSMSTDQSVFEYQTAPLIFTQTSRFEFTEATEKPNREEDYTRSKDQISRPASSEATDNLQPLHRHSPTGTL
jgi:hypothetical protein